MIEEANLRLVQEIYEFFSRGDIAAILNVIDQEADLEFEGPNAIPWAGTWRGRDGWTRFFQTLAGNADEIAVDMKPFAAQGGNVVTVGRYRARVKRTGQRIDSPLAHFWTIRNGMVVNCREFTNTATEAAAFTARAEAGND